jgi:hypothetical protein
MSTKILHDESNKIKSNVTKNYTVTLMVSLLISNNGKQPIVLVSPDVFPFLLQMTLIGRQG